MRLSKLHFKRKYLTFPYLIFCVFFVILPLLLILFYAFVDKNNQFSLKNFGDFFTSSGDIGVLLRSILIATLNTIFCLLIGYPIAMILANKKYNKSYVIVLLFVMPMWINFVLRTSAMRDLLSWMGISGAEHSWLTTMIGMVYNYLPFVILPLYSTMLKMDKNQIEASYDLGANKVQTFIKTIIPMTMPGIISAAMMVFLPTMSSYVICDIMSERKLTIIGNLIYTTFENQQYNMGSAYALIVLIFVGLSMFFVKNKEDSSVRGGGLW